MKMNRNRRAALAVGMALAVGSVLLSREWDFGDFAVIPMGWHLRVPAWGPAWFEYSSPDPLPLSIELGLIGMATAAALAALRDRPL